MRCLTTPTIFLSFLEGPRLATQRQSHQLSFWATERDLLYGRGPFEGAKRFFVQNTHDGLRLAHVANFIQRLFCLGRGIEATEVQKHDAPRGAAVPPFPPTLFGRPLLRFVPSNMLHMLLSSVLLSCLASVWAAPTCQLATPPPEAASVSSSAPSTAPTVVPSPPTQGNETEVDMVAITWYAGWHTQYLSIADISWSKYTAVHYAFA